MPSSLIPPDFEVSGPGYLIAELAFVVLVLAGLVAVWRPVRARVMRHRAPFAVVAAEALLAVPWLAFPIVFLVSVAGGYRASLLVLQAVLAAAGAWLLWSRRDAILASARRAAGAARSDIPYLCALAAIVLFTLWGWLMPFPEGNNGHQHDLVNQLRQLWDESEYALLSQEEVSYDNNILIWPAPFVMLLSLFTFQGIDEVGIRPIFLLAPVCALLTLQLLRLTARDLGRESAGPIAFLLVAFSYYAAADFTDLTFDLLSPLMLAYFGHHVVRWVARDEGSALPFLIVLAVSFLVRRQVFLLMAGVLLALLVLRLLPWRAFVRRPRAPAAALAALLLAPVILWSAVAWSQYDSPFYPHDTELTKLVFDPPVDEAAPGLGDPASGAEPEEGPVDKRVDRVRDFFSERVNGRPFVVEHFLPLVRDDIPALLKGALAGVSLSLLLTLGAIAFLVLAGRMDGLGIDARRSRLLLAAYVIGFALVGIEFLGNYPKYPHYLGFLIAPLAAVAIVDLARRVLRGVGPALVAAGLLAVGVGLWAVSTWGHAEWDWSARNVKFLNPYHGAAIDRLSRDAGLSVPDLRRHEREYVTALDAGDGRVLQMEHEPGALVPALVDREFLGRALYIDGKRTHDLLLARDRAELARALERLDIGYVFRPRRAHGRYDETLILRLAREHQGPSRFVVPVDELLARPPG